MHIFVSAIFLCIIVLVIAIEILLDKFYKTFFCSCHGNASNSGHGLRLALLLLLFFIIVYERRSKLLKNNFVFTNSHERSEYDFLPL